MPTGTVSHVHNRAFSFLTGPARPLGIGIRNAAARQKQLTSGKHQVTIADGHGEDGALKLTQTHSESKDVGPCPNRTADKE